MKTDRDRSTDKIINELEEMVLTGVFGVNGRLDEIRLAQHFGVSRTPVREALQKLAHSGLVEQLPRRGVFVRELQPTEIFDMFEVMAEIEGLCGRLAAGRISDEAVQQLDALNKECHLAAEARDPDGYYAKNELFHDLIYRETGNSFLAEEASRLHRRLKPFRRMQLQLRGRMAESMQQHDQIVEAIANGDADLAAKLLYQHVNVQGDKFHLLVSSYAKRANSA